MSTELSRIVCPIRLPDEAARQAARERHGQLTKPAGSLGLLEDLAVQLAGIARTPTPTFHRKAVLVLAADHGVAEEGVSAYPQAVTAQMVLNFLSGGAAINVLARQAGARVVVADLGVASDLPPHPDLRSLRVGPGTANIARGPAMRHDQAIESIARGSQIVDAEVAAGIDLIATGDMGIANTTSASAIIAAMTGIPPAEVTGRGTGLDDRALQRKIGVIEQAIALNAPDPTDPIDVLTKIGGYEIGGLVGAILQGAGRGLPVVVDGLASGAAALVAAAIQPDVTHYLIAAHRSVEPGHRIVLDRLGLRPLLDLDLRLGEGTGAALAMSLIDSAAALLREMATFADAGVSRPPALWGVH